MRRDKHADCEACWQRDCDCTCRTCVSARDRRVSLADHPGQQWHPSQFANTPRIKP